VKTRVVLCACAALVLAPLAVVHGVLRASLAQLDGDIAEMGIVAPVTIDRDALGVPTIEAANRVDLAYATGFVHGQDRFFQMDLSRRLAAGELSEIVGEVALEQDEKARIFRFRSIARSAIQHATPEQRAVLEAYSRGVNAGLGNLRSRPWEYWVLRSDPSAWRPEDTVLVSYAMWWDLQYSDFRHEMVRQEINARLGGPVCASGWKCGLQFFFPARTSWDAPNSVGEVGAAAAGAVDTPAGEATGTSVPFGVDFTGVPPPAVIDIRGAATSVVATPIASVENYSNSGLGSNNWAVAGRLTSTGAALIANDMHLRARVPTVWYRARLRVTGTSLDLNGVTLPGAPLLVAGSNGRIAWGFTNSYGDWIHMQQVPCIAVSANEIQTPSATLALSVQPEEIRIHGKPSVMLSVRSGPAGVLFEAHPEQHSCWFAAWLAQRPGATNLNLMNLERASTVAQAVQLAPAIGIPHQNLVVGDRAGHIAWTIAGRIPIGSMPDRVSNDSPWTDVDTHPRIVDPPVGRIWTANARATDDSGQEAAIGGDQTTVGAHYDLAARAHQIRDDLLEIQGASRPADMLRIQLDDRAVFLDRWRTMLLDLIDADSVASHPDRADFKQLVSGWNMRASADSVGYRLVRAYRDRTEQAVWAMLMAGLKVEAGQEVAPPPQFESALWHLVSERPLHMLAADYGSWRQFLLAQLDATLGDLRRRCGDLRDCTWGSRKPVQIQHPLARSLPFLARFLDMPTVELPGDEDMPRVQDGPIGASERFAVSPGHEDQGYIHMPGGQSGHPLSPYYKAGFLDWARGTPTPFLPGTTQHRLTLQPQ
jgi:penicillin amidase